MTYTVDLVDLPGLPESARTEAVMRYRRALEERLGGAQNVPYYVRVFIKASESNGDSMSKSESEAAVAFLQAQEAAQQAGFEGLADVLYAYFDVQLN